MAGISDKALGKLDSKNKFDGGVNFEEDYGVNLYSTFFRNYDPQIGRFDGVDVLSERTFGISVYGYCGNDPTMFIDPRGSEKAITQNEFDMMLASPNGGIWSASGGMELFGSQDEAFMFGALHYGGGGESSGGGGTFEQMLNRYNGGNLTSSLVAAFFKFTWGSEASDITAYAIAGGFNVGFTATSTGNHYSNDFFSTKSILSSFNFLTTLYNGKEDALFDQNRQNAWGITTKIASDFDYSTVTTMDVMTTSLAASKELSAETFHIISDVPVLKQFGVASSVIGAIDHGAKFLQDPNWKDGLEFLGNTALLAAHVLVPEATLAVDAAEFIYNNVTSLVDLFTDD